MNYNNTTMNLNQKSVYIFFSWSIQPHCVLVTPISYIHAVRWIDGRRTAERLGRQVWVQNMTLLLREEPGLCHLVPARVRVFPSSIVRRGKDRRGRIKVGAERVSGALGRERGIVGAREERPVARRCSVRELEAHRLGVPVGAPQDSAAGFQSGLSRCSRGFRDEVPCRRFRCLRLSDFPRKCPMRPRARPGRGGMEAMPI